MARVVAVAQLAPLEMRVAAAGGGFCPVLVVLGYAVAVLVALRVIKVVLGRELQTAAAVAGVPMVAYPAKAVLAELAARELNPTAIVSY